MGPVELQLGLAAAALGRLDAAVPDLEAAVSTCDANGARGYAVQARVELAAALTRRQAPGDVGPAAAALDAAAGEAEQLGMVPFTERIGRLRARLPAVTAADRRRSAPVNSEWPCVLWWCRYRIARYRRIRGAR